MEQKILDFLAKERISVLTTLRPDWFPHSATMHFGFDGENFVFFTKEKSKKCTNFEYGEKYKASLVVGFDEKEFIELQAEGMIEKIEKEKSKPEEKVFASKFGGAELDSEHVVLKFKPTWYRYTEFKPEFLTIESK